ncbi:Alpha/Beta hydrolase protein [Radiomyces spectabilis]|uniref:Alpha/Beta hydrolase protein n=1 Tax=Radiomyces spectabilis TaxID=64574 RepID=UPI00221F8E9A|nr:Alpha/Beta hydrolase protein [Radiomyces spectabilis]KAI8377567.1 Alpha/Beta hydrolase protein [Radiomyces spectabilis]
MLDHLVGRPSANWKRIQIILTLITGCWILAKGKTNRLPQIFQTWNRSTARHAPWKIALASWMFYYLLRNLFHLVGLNAPEPLARLYKRSFYRATWILTALDAGFFTAMPLKPMWLRHITSLLFSSYYLVFADAAEEKVRRVRATMSVDQMRVSWEKGATNPILFFAAGLLRPKLSMRRIMLIDRPSYNEHLPPVEIYLFYAGDCATFVDNDTLLLQFPGGGFVSMPPPCHEDAIAAWAKQTGLPICSVNYKKAPEYPYPWQINECFDLYLKLIETQGKILGLSGEKPLKVIILGDSAGGNLTAAVILKIIEHNKKLEMTFMPNLQDSLLTTSYVMADTEQASSKTIGSILDKPIPMPVGLILIYPALDFEMSCWMAPSQLSLIRAESKSQLFRTESLESLWQSKDHLSHASPLSVVPDIDDQNSLWRRVTNKLYSRKTSATRHSQTIRERVHSKPPAAVAWESSRLALTSRMSYFNDRIITPDLMRAMAILYLGPHACPEFESDYLLSPTVAPLDLLARFPKTYMMCGEKDPLVDDTVIFAGRLRQAKSQNHQDGQFDGIRVKFLQGMSHAFLQMMAFLPEAQQATRAIGDWILELRNDASHDPSSNPTKTIHSSVDIIQVTTDTGGHHVAEIVTTEKDMIHRRKQQVVKSLYAE